MRKKTRHAALYVAHFLVCFVAFTALSLFVLIYHGPFPKLRDSIVSESMATNSNRFFATAFLPRAEIDAILARTNSQVQDGQENVGGIDITKPASPTPAPTGLPGGSPTPAGPRADGVTIIPIEGATFHAKLLVIADPSRVVLGVAPKLGQTGAPLSEIVRLAGASGGINAGGFLDDQFMGTGADPKGILIQDGRILFQQSGLTRFSIIGFNRSDVLVISNGMTLDQIAASDLRCAISFGPALILNGKPLVTRGGTALEPRSAIAQRKDGTILMLAIDGRQAGSPGANLVDVQNVLLQYGAYNAANLDGGSSTTLNFLGRTIDVPCDIAGERSIASAFLIAG